MIILEALMKANTHPNADEIFQLVRKRIKNISYGTIYRNLSVLKKMGLIGELNIGKTCTRYEVNQEKHQHFICTKCDKIYNIKPQVKVEADSVQITDISVKVKDYRLEFFGICPNCRRTNK